jgi:hypothetical protein
MTRTATYLTITALSCLGAPFLVQASAPAASAPAATVERSAPVAALTCPRQVRVVYPAYVAPTACAPAQARKEG